MTRRCTEENAPGFRGTRPRTASLYTLGCRLNQADAALVADDLRRVGFEIVPWGKAATLLVVNSCTVTRTAAAKTRQAVRAARRRCPEAFLVVAGCGVNVDPAAWRRDPDVDLIIANPAKTTLSRYLPPDLRRPGKAEVVKTGYPAAGALFTEAGCGYFPDRTRANIKIQEGCDFACSYCIVPRARGPARSRAWDDILREAAEQAAAGCRELVLTGVNIAQYRDGRRNLADLLPALLAVTPGARIRLSSTEPGPVLEGVVDVMAAEARVCRFLHLPLQYGEDRVLAAMNRRYRVADFAAVVDYAVARVPGLCIGSDIILGFPGETDETFERCWETVAAMPFAYLHIFSYSARPGTAASTLPGRVDGRIVGSRRHRLEDLASAKALAFAGAQVGARLSVLTETLNAAGHAEGWSDNYLRVEIVDSEAPPAPNVFVSVDVSGVRTGRAVYGRVQSG